MGRVWPVTFLINLLFLTTVLRHDSWLEVTFTSRTWVFAKKIREKTSRCKKKQTLRLSYILKQVGGLLPLPLIYILNTSSTHKQPLTTFIENTTQGGSERLSRYWLSLTNREPEFPILTTSIYTAKTTRATECS